MQIACKIVCKKLKFVEKSGKLTNYTQQGVRPRGPAGAAMRAVTRPAHVRAGTIKYFL